MPTKSEELAQQMDALAKEIKALYDAHKTSVPNEYDFSPEDMASVRTKSDELAELKRKHMEEEEKERILKNAEEIERYANTPQNALPFPGLDPRVQYVPIQQRKSLGELFVGSPAFKEFDPLKAQGPSVEIPYEWKTTLDEASGFAPQAVRIARIEQYPTRQLVVADAFPQGTTDQIAIVYMEETTFTNNAAETAEGGQYPENALAFTEKSSAVRKVAAFLPVTDELMADVSGMRSYVDQRLTYMVQAREDSQLLVGNGTPPNLRGLLNVVGIQTQPRGADTAQDAVFKAITNVQAVGFANPSAVMIHPTDWQGIRLAKTSTGDYIWGHPAIPGPTTLWGLPVIVTTAITQGTAVVADFRGFTMIFRKQGLAVSVSNSHSDFFIKGLLAIRAEERLALVVFRPKAVCTITGL